MNMLCFLRSYFAKHKNAFFSLAFEKKNLQRNNMKTRTRVFLKSHFIVLFWPIVRPRPCGNLYMNKYRSNRFSVLFSSQNIHLVSLSLNVTKIENVVNSNVLSLITLPIL